MILTLDQQAAIQEYVRRGWITTKHSLCGHYMLLNYNDIGMYNGGFEPHVPSMWTPTLKLCRGLVVDVDSYEIVAMPFPKFFNYEQYSPDEQSRIEHQIFSNEFTFYDKLDGSLILAWWDSYAQTFRFSTRGSFDSPQAQAVQEYMKRTGKLDKMNAHESYIPKNYTHLFEWIGASNQIVCSYGKDQLMYLHSLHNNYDPTKELFSSDSSREAIWDELDIHSSATKNLRGLGEIEEYQQSELNNEEGVVGYNYVHDIMVKFKKKEYVRLHGVISGFSVKRVFDILRDFLSEHWKLQDSPPPFVDFLKLFPGNLPDEYTRALHFLYNSVVGVVDIQLGCVVDKYKSFITSRAGKDCTKKNFVEYLNDGDVVNMKSIGLFSAATTYFDHSTHRTIKQLLTTLPKRDSDLQRGDISLIDYTSDGEYYND